MRILVLCYEYPPIGGGGGRVAQTVARGLAARGHEVRVQTAALGFRSSREDDHCVTVFRTASGRRAADTCRVHEMATYCATSLLPSLRHIHDWKPDIIHAHFAVPTGALALALHTLTKTPYLITAHLGDVPGGVPEQTDTLFKLAAPIANKIWHHAAGCTAVSSFVKNLAETAYQRPVTQILNGIDTHGAPQPPPPHRPRRLVLLGRLSVQKNPLFLIDSLAQATAAGWHLTIIGDGPLRPELEHRIAVHNLTDRVTLRGWLTAPEVHVELAASDILLMPSLSEGLPVAAIEALKHGLALIATEIPGLRDVLDPGENGLHSPLGDNQAFAANVLKLCTDDALAQKMRLNSRSKAETFALPKIITQYETALTQAATQSAPCLSLSPR